MKSYFIFPLMLMLLMPMVVRADNGGQGLLWSQYQTVKVNKHNTLTKPVVLQSAEQDDRLRADVYSEVKHDFTKLTRALSAIENWCDFMPLNLNIKACVYQRQGQQQYITFYAGRKFYQTPDEAEPLRYHFSVAQLSEDYIRVVLRAEQGPFGTRDYHISVQAMPLGPALTLIHVHSAYTTSLWSRMGTGIYLSTLGRDKEGFTIEGYDANRQPRYVKGVQGIIERNTVRYYLALLALLETRELPQGQQFEQRLSTWFDMTQAYQRQLYELDKDEYLSAKHRERQNQILLQGKIVMP